MPVRTRVKAAAAATALVTALGLGVAPSAGAGTPASAGVVAPAHHKNFLPQTITLPNDLIAGDLGFQPEGIVVRGITAYVGSLVDGTVVTANLLTGEVEQLVAPAGAPAVGLALAGPYLLVSGGPSGQVRVYNAFTGDEVAIRDIDGAGFINDVTVTGGVAYFTDSQRAVLYALPLFGRGAFQVSELPLTGDFQLADGFNANGIVARGNTLIVGQSTDPDGTGSALYAVDRRTGVSARITVNGGDIENADGLVLQGRTLYVVQNRSNSVAVLQLAPNLLSAQQVNTITNPNFAVPTTADLALGALYTVNARFGTTPSDAVEYEIVRTPLPGRR